MSPHRNTNIGLIPHYSNDAAPSLWLHIFSTSASWHNHICKEVPPMEANGIRFPQTKINWGSHGLSALNSMLFRIFPVKLEAGERRWWWHCLCLHKHIQTKYFPSAPQPPISLSVLPTVLRKGRLDWISGGFVLFIETSEQTTRYFWQFHLFIHLLPEYLLL